MRTPRLTTKSPAINVMASAIYKAARGLIRDFGEVEHLQVSKKGLGDFVSIADKRSEQILIEELTKARPGYNFLTEETGEILGEQGTSFTWIIDPLDGTTNFLHGFPHFAVVVALKKEDEVIAAITYDPIKDEMFWAEKGQGAFQDYRRIRVSVRNKFDESLIAAGYAYPENEERENVEKNVSKLSRAGASLRCTGSAALDLAYVAAGRLDAACLWKLKPWDIAGGMLMVLEAGGYVSDFSKEQSMMTTGNVLAGNPLLHSMLLKALG